MLVYAKSGYVRMSLGILCRRNCDWLWLGNHRYGFSEYRTVSDSIEDQSVLSLVVEPSDDSFQPKSWLQIRDICIDEQHFVIFEQFKVRCPSFLEGKLCDILQLGKSWKAFLLHRPGTVRGETCLSRGIVYSAASLAKRECEVASVDRLNFADHPWNLQSSLDS